MCFFLTADKTYTVQINEPKVINTFSALPLLFLSSFRVHSQYAGFYRFLNNLSDNLTLKFEKCIFSQTEMSEQSENEFS